MNSTIKTQSSLEMDQLIRINTNKSKSVHRVAIYSRTLTRWSFAHSVATQTTKSACSEPGTILELLKTLKLVNQAQEALSACSAPISFTFGKA